MPGFPGLRLSGFAGNFPALEAGAPYDSVTRGERRLWAIAFAASLVVGALLLWAVITFLFLMALASEVFQLKKSPEEPQKASLPETVSVSPEMLQVIPSTEMAPAAPVPPKAMPPEAVRTSEDQRGRRPDKPAFIGERDTEATSDRAPDPDAPRMPSQKGRAPRNDGEIETTESIYQDGLLPEQMDPLRNAAMTPPSAPPSLPVPPVREAAATPAPAAPPAPATPPSSEKAMVGDKAAPEVPAPAELAQGPNPVDVPVPKPMPEQKPPPTPSATSAENGTAKAAPPEQSPPSPPKPRYKDPAFRGNQSKTAIRGSISRSGRSALDVADTPLGRYQATISRAVEQEWQRNCVRHRDLITPGFLTVRFFVTAGGKVKSVQFVGDMQTGEVQKGFTLNSIRDAEIPPMPAALKAEFQDESLELIFNFYF